MRAGGCAALAAGACGGATTCGASIGAELAAHSAARIGQPPAAAIASLVFDPACSPQPIT